MCEPGQVNNIDGDCCHKQQIKICCHRNTHINIIVIIKTIIATGINTQMELSPLSERGYFPILLYLGISGIVFPIFLQYYFLDSLNLSPDGHV